jgi:hypothetical protein
MNKPTQEDIQARRRFVAWVQWYRAMYPDVVPTRNALAEKLRISGSAVTQLLAADAYRAPSFETLLAFKRLSGFSLDQLVFGDPPPIPKDRTK